MFPASDLSPKNTHSPAPDTSTFADDQGAVVDVLGLVGVSFGLGLVVAEVRISSAKIRRSKAETLLQNLTLLYQGLRPVSCWLHQIYTKKIRCKIHFLQLDIQDVIP